MKKLSPAQSALAMFHAIEHPEQHAEQAAITARERSWLKRIGLWREELQRASAAPGIAGACILLKRYLGNGGIEFGALSRASRPKNENYQVPENSALGPALATHRDDPSMVALIERMYSSWDPVSLIQWRMKKGRIIPSVLHVKQYRNRKPHGAELNAMITEMMTEGGAKSLLRMIGDHAVRHDAGLPALPASSEEGRRDAGQAHPLKGDIIEEVKRFTDKGSFSKESLKRDTLAAHPEWDQESRDKVDACVAFVWRSFIAKHRLRIW